MRHCCGASGQPRKWPQRVCATATLLYGTDRPKPYRAPEPVTSACSCGWDGVARRCVEVCTAGSTGVWELVERIRLLCGTLLGAWTHSAFRRRMHDCMLPGICAPHALDTGTDRIFNCQKIAGVNRHCQLLTSPMCYAKSYAGPLLQNKLPFLPNSIRPYAPPLCHVRSLGRKRRRTFGSVSSVLFCAGGGAVHETGTTPL